MWSSLSQVIDMGGEPATVLWKVAELFKTVVTFSIFLMNDGGSVMQWDSGEKKRHSWASPHDQKMKEHYRIFVVACFAGVPLTFQGDSCHAGAAATFVGYNALVFTSVWWVTPGYVELEYRYSVSEGIFFAASDFPVVLQPSDLKWGCPRHFTLQLHVTIFHDLHGPQFPDKGGRL